jgi:hypothetical protein
MGTILSTFSLMEFFSRNDFPLKTILVLDMLREMCWDVSQLSIWIRLSGLRTIWKDWNVSGLSFQFVRAHRLLKVSLWLLNIFCYFFTILIRPGACVSRLNWKAINFKGLRAVLDQCIYWNSICIILEVAT